MVVVNVVNGNVVEALMRLLVPPMRVQFGDGDFEPDHGDIVVIVMYVVSSFQQSRVKTKQTVTSWRNECDSSSTTTAIKTWSGVATFS